MPHSKFKPDNNKSNTAKSSSKSSAKRSGKFSHLKEKSGKSPLIANDPDNVPKKRRRDSKAKSRDMLRFFDDQGFLRFRSRKMMKKCKKLVKRSIKDTVKPILNFLKKKKYSKKERAIIAARCPRIFLRSKETIKRRHGIVEEKIPEYRRQVIIENPSVLLMADNSLIDRLDLFIEIAHEIGMQKIFSNPIWVSFSPKTIRKRREFLKKRIGRKYSHYDLFKSKRWFKKRFGVDL